MGKLSNGRVAAIVPALNEEANVGKVLKILLSSKFLDEIILVDDGSIDKTAEIGEKLGVKVVKIVSNIGKGGAMRRGAEFTDAEFTDAEFIIFFDADLVGLSLNHICSLVKPVLSGQADMCVGIREKAVDTKNFGPLMALGGERAMKKDLLEKIPEKIMQGFAVETAINYYCLKKNLKVEYVPLNGLSIVIKEKKWGLVRGFLNRLKMISEIIKIRLILIFYKNEFI